MLRERVINLYKERRDKLINGNFNSIPSPFKRFSNDFIGLEQGKYYLISSYTKGGKSQLMNFLLFRAIMFAYYTKSDLSIKIIYFNLEETKERIMSRFISWLLFTWTKGEHRYSIMDLMSSKTGKPLPEEVLDLLETEELKDIMDYFENCIIFSDEKNPTGIWKKCIEYLHEHGTVKTKPAKYRDDMGIIRETQTFDSYTPNDPNEYVFAVVDTINIISSERGFTKKQSIDKLSEYFIDLRNDYNLSPIVVQQQNTDNESIDSVKLGRTRPTPSGLGDSKYTSHDCNLMLGIYSPYKFGLKEYLGYPIDRLKDNFRTLEVCTNRDGEVGGIVPLFFDGDVCNWYELPNYDDTPNMNKVFNYIKKVNNKKKIFFIHIIKSSINKIFKTKAWKWK